jgi:2-keto-3-deoxy-L-rhamnonate aldolase RhmA
MSATVRNVAREKLEQGHLSLGVGVRLTRSVEIAKAMAVAGFHWLFLDMEHGVMSLEACAQISIAALDAGIAPIARVPNGEYAIATRALDNGALGIVMPHVDTAAEAVTIRTKDGRTSTSTVYSPKGSGANGIAWSDVDAKYRALMPHAQFNEAQIEASLALIHDFDRQTSVVALIDLLSP